MGWLVKIYIEFEEGFSIVPLSIQESKKEGSNKHNIKVILKSQQELKYIEYRVV